MAGCPAHGNAHRNVIYPTMNAKITRRQLFRLKPSDVLDMVLKKEKPSEDQSHYSDIFRPPGAFGAEEEFLSLCEGCPHCSQACPYDVITHLGPASGVLEGTPVLDPNSSNPCRWCPEMHCVTACPTGALTLGHDNKSPPPIGKAVLNRETCLAEEGILCDRCAVTCPSGIKAISMVNRKPVLDREKCTGCGLCVLYCESTPISLRIVPVNRQPTKN